MSQVDAQKHACKTTFPIQMLKSTFDLHVHLFFIPQTACAFATAKVIYLIPQIYMSLYLLDTLKMDKVGMEGGVSIYAYKHIYSL